MSTTSAFSFQPRWIPADLEVYCAFQVQACISHGHRHIHCLQHGVTHASNNICVARFLEAAYQNHQLWASCCCFPTCPAEPEYYPIWRILAKIWWRPWAVFLIGLYRLEACYSLWRMLLSFRSWLVRWYDCCSFISPNVGCSVEFPKDTRTLPHFRWDLVVCFHCVYSDAGFWDMT